MKLHKLKLKVPAAVKIVVEEQGRVIGRVYVYVLKNDLHRRPFALLEDLFVDESARNRGLGTALIKAAAAEARRRKCYKLIGTSRRSRTGLHGFYRRLGFSLHGVELRMDL
ncbi:MAG TPA: GNAT family N-acetyltransferase [Patescibacteria group bacterium]|nr:GNAT family N-acetyltransferase [Patescibacteria group bacterium]